MSKPCSWASGMILSLKGTRAPSTKPPITTFLPAALAGVAEPRPARSAAPAPPLSRLRRFTPSLRPSVELMFHPPAIDSVNDGDAFRVEKTCIVGIEFRANFGADARREALRGAD